MRRALALWLAAVAVAACAPHEAWTTATTTPFRRSSQPFNLYTHCGILSTSFAGRTFYLQELYPARVTIAGDPVAEGTMTVLSAHEIEFVDAAGHQARFVDQLPGQLNHPYPFSVHVLSGGNQLIDEPFAGRVWQTHETLPGIMGPPYGNGLDRFTTVNGALTLVSDSEAVFKSEAGAVVYFTVRPPTGCD